MYNAETLFLHVVEAGSFKKAAKQLNIEASTLSRRIAKLEKRLNAKLLQRSTAKTYPTEIGQMYYEGLRKITNDQQALEEEIFNQNNQIKGHLRVSTTVDLGDNFITPIIASMQKQAPELSIEMVLSSDIDDLVERNIDVAIRIGALKDSNLYARPLGEIPRMLVASREYIEHHGTPTVANDLASHNFILYSALQSKLDIQFQDGSLFSHQKMQSNVLVNSLSSIKVLVNEGYGINWGPRWLYKEGLEKGQLVEVLPNYPVQGFILHALYTTSTYLPYKTKWFLKLLSEKLNFNQTNAS